MFNSIGPIWWMTNMFNNHQQRVWQSGWSPGQAIKIGSSENSYQNPRVDHHFPTNPYGPIWDGRISQGRKHLVLIVLKTFGEVPEHVLWSDWELRSKSRSWGFTKPPSPTKITSRPVASKGPFQGIACVVRSHAASLRRSSWRSTWDSLDMFRLWSMNDDEFWWEMMRDDESRMLCICCALQTWVKNIYVVVPISRVSAKLGPGTV